MRTGKQSKTAKKVALNIVTLGTKHGMEETLPPGIVDATARLLVESGAVGRRAVRFSRSRMAVAIYLAFDWLMPGQFEAFAHRKAFFEREVRKGIEQGASQVLVLGAGYDTLGWRLAPEFSRVNFFEFTYVGTRPDETPDAGPWSWLVLWLLKVGGEPWLWSISPGDLRSFLGEEHWTVGDDRTGSTEKCGIEFHGMAVK